LKAFEERAVSRELGADKQRESRSASEIKSPRSESDYANNEAPRATGNYLCKYTVATGAFYPLCTRAARRGEEKLAGASIAEDTRLADRRRSTAPTERVPVKSVHGQAMDGIAEIRWVIALRVMYGRPVEPASCPHAHTHNYEIHLNETRSNAPSCNQLTRDKGKNDLCSRIR